MSHIKKIRDTLGMTQEELGDILHLTREMISRLENGKAVVQPRTMKLLEVFAKERGYSLTIDGDYVSMDRDPATINHLQERMLEQQTIHIRNLEKLISDKLLLNEAYLKVLTVELNNLAAFLKKEDADVRAKRMANMLHEELESIRKDTMIFYSR